MPRLTKALPKYRKHRASGQAIVTLNGVDFYLGPHGTKASKIEYDRIVGEWLENGRRLPAAKDEMTIVELTARYWKFAKQHYVKNGKPTGEQPGIKAAIKPLKDVYGHTNASDFGPLALKAIRERIVAAGNSRRYVNKNIGRIKRMFKWGVEEELVPVTVYQSLAAVAGLRRGKTKAHDYAPVQPVSEETIKKTLPCLRRVVADMVRLQQFTGCRPGEICILRPQDVDRSGEIWEYRPASHKTQHHGKARVILLGPKAQEILAQYLLQPANGYCFRVRGGRNRPLGVSHYRMDRDAGVF
jgi:integrase